MKPFLGVSLDRNNNHARLDRQPRIIHNTSKHLNEGFFGVSSLISCDILGARSMQPAGEPISLSTRLKLVFHDQEEGEISGTSVPSNFFGKGHILKRWVVTLTEEVPIVTACTQL